MEGTGRPGDLASVLDDHLAAEFDTQNLEATMATMTEDPWRAVWPLDLGGIPVAPGPSFTFSPPADSQR